MMTAAMSQADTSFPETVHRLSELVRIPSCSFPGFDPAQVEASAMASAAWLREAGFPVVDILRLDGCPHPWVVAEDRRAGPGVATVLLYAHHDVQPPLRSALWTTPPHEPTQRGGRLYGRGSADDKAGIAVHCAAAAAWNRTAGNPPVNLVVLIEGEEEIGSPHFEHFVASHLDRLRADVAVIADLANVAQGVPSLTTSLRGHLVWEIELAALRAPLHSGMWGGTVPDPAMGLCKLLAMLTDDDGRIAVPGVLDQVRPVSAEEQAGWARVPYNQARFRADAGLLRADPPADSVEACRRLWREPSLTVTSIQSGTRGQTGNVVMDSAWARIGLRLVPDQDPETVATAMETFLLCNAPGDCECTITPRSRGAAWATVTDHPHFAAAREALRIGYGVPPVEIGCGASIPFVGSLSAALGGIPMLLLGVEDPACAAHAENESVHLGDLQAAIRAETALFALLAGPTA